MNVASTRVAAEARSLSTVSYMCINVVSLDGGYRNEYIWSMSPLVLCCTACRRPSLMSWVELLQVCTLPSWDTPTQLPGKREAPAATPSLRVQQLTR